MSSKHTRTRVELLEFITAALDEHDNVTIVDIREDRQGPMGGISAQVSGYLDGGKGRLGAFSINIYSDRNIEEGLERTLEDVEREERVRERLTAMQDSRMLVAGDVSEATE